MIQACQGTCAQCTLCSCPYVQLPLRIVPEYREDSFEMPSVMQTHLQPKSPPVSTHHHCC